MGSHAILTGMPYRIQWLLGLVLAFVLLPDTAWGQSIIRREGAHPRYGFEAEPHLIIRDRTGFRGTGVGPGFRGTVVVADKGFISRLNDSVGVGFGLDWLVFDDCDDNVGNNGNGNGNPCLDDGSQFVLPVVMQWNFWLHPQWSVFGEPGLAITINDGPGDDLDIDPFVLYGGGRFLFSPDTALTMRIGFPTSLSIGVSFLL